MLDLLGSGYVIEHCVSAFLEKQEEKAYKIYMSDCLYSIVNMYAVSHGGTDMPVQKRFVEIIDVMEKKPKKEETAEDIITRMREKAKRMNK